MFSYYQGKHFCYYRKTPSTGKYYPIIGTKEPRAASDDHPPTYINTSPSKPSYSHQVAAMPGVFHCFQSLPFELQFMVWEEFLRGVDKRNIVLLNAKPVSQPGDEDWDWSWYLELENHEQLHMGPASVMARSLMALCGSSRYVATRVLGATQLSEPTSMPIQSELTLSLVRDVFWVPDDLVQFMKTTYDSVFRPNRDEPRVAFECQSHLAPFETSTTYTLDLHRIKYAMISLHTFEQAILWSDPDSEWCGGDSIEAFLSRKYCLARLNWEFLGVPNLIVMVDVPRVQVSWEHIQIVGVDDPALYELGAKRGPDRFLSARRDFKALCKSWLSLDDETHETLPGDEMSDGSLHFSPSHQVHVEDSNDSDDNEESDDGQSENAAFNEWRRERIRSQWAWWDCRGPEISFAFLKQ